MSLCQRSSVLVATGCCDSVTAPDDEVSRVFERRKIFEIEENMSKSTKIRSGAIPFRVRAQRAQAGGSQGPGAGQAAGRRQLPGPRRSSADVGNAQDILLNNCTRHQRCHLFQLPAGRTLSMRRSHNASHKRCNPPPPRRPSDDAT